MIQVRWINCCGLRELSELSEYTRRPRRALMDIFLASTYRRYGSRGRILKSRDPQRFGMFLFTQASVEENPPYRQAYGDQLKRLIERLKLGTVTTIGPFVNPNTSNYIRTYNWVVDWPRAMKFLHQELRKIRK